MCAVEPINEEYSDIWSIALGAAHTLTVAGF